MKTTLVQLTDLLPLTCSREGTCCHGNQVYINPWELACLANEKQISTQAFKEQFCSYGGILLHFNGKKDKRGKAACSQYIENFGCSVHAGRPLACRIFPLGRQVQSGEVQYIFQGNEFPCFQGCAAVKELPHLRVVDYLEGQQTSDFEKAQDLYLEIMQNLADIAFELLLDTGLAETKETETLKSWCQSSRLHAEELAEKIPTDWINALLLPENLTEFGNVEAFATRHNEQLQIKAQQAFQNLTSWNEIREASVLMFRLSLYLATALGANPTQLADFWIQIAKENGALG